MAALVHSSRGVVLPAQFVNRFNKTAEMFRICELRYAMPQIKHMPRTGAERLKYAARMVPYLCGLRE